jgi:hypothetical protein
VLDGLRWSNFLLAYHGEDDKPLQAAYAAFVGATLERVAPGRARHYHRDAGRASGCASDSCLHLPRRTAGAISSTGSPA